MPDNTNLSTDPVVQFTEAQVQSLVTAIFSSVNDRIAERISQRVVSGDTKHIPSVDAVNSAVEAGMAAALAASQENAAAISELSDKVGDGTDAAIEYTDTQINALRTTLMGMNHWNVTAVTGELPTTDDADNRTIYLQRDSETDTTWMMYILVDGAWIGIGDTEIDLTNYWEKDNVDGITNALFENDAFKNKLDDYIRSFTDAATKSIKDMMYDGGSAAHVSSNFAEAYGLDFGSDEYKSITFKFDGFNQSFSINNTSTVSDVIEQLNSMLFNENLTASIADDGTIVVNGEDGPVQFTVIVDGTELTPVYVGGSEPIFMGIKVNGELVPVQNKSVDISVPTKTSQLQNDANYQTEEDVAAKVSEAIENENLDDIYMKNSAFSAIFGEADIGSASFLSVYGIDAPDGSARVEFDDKSGITTIITVKSTATVAEITTMIDGEIHIGDLTYDAAGNLIATTPEGEVVKIIVLVDGVVVTPTELDQNAVKQRIIDWVNGSGTIANLTDDDISALKELMGTVDLSSTYTSLEKLKELLAIEGELTAESVEQAILTIVQNNEVESVPITDEKINSIVANALTATAPDLSYDEDPT